MLDFQLEPTMDRRRFDEIKQLDQIWSGQLRLKVQTKGCQERHFITMRHQINIDVSRTFYNNISQQIPMSFKTGNWSPNEDQKLRQIVEAKRTAKWSTISRKLNRLRITSHKRTSSECRQRWINYLDPAINTEKWTPEQEQNLFDLHSELGNSWTLISRRIPGRPSIAVKNHFYAALRKGLRKLNKEIRKSFKQNILKPIPKRFVSKVLCMMSPKHKIVKFEGIRQSCVSIVFSENVDLVSQVLKFSRFVHGDEQSRESLSKVVEACKILNPAIQQNSRTNFQSECDEKEDREECEAFLAEGKEMKIPQKRQQGPKIETPPNVCNEMQQSGVSIPQQSSFQWVPLQASQMCDQSMFMPQAPPHSQYPVINWMSGPITYFQNQYWFGLSQ